MNRKKILILLLLALMPCITKPAARRDPLKRTRSGRPYGTVADPQKRISRVEADSKCVICQEEFEGAELRSVLTEDWEVYPGVTLERGIHDVMHTWCCGTTHHFRCLVSYVIDQHGNEINSCPICRNAPIFFDGFREHVRGKFTNLYESLLDVVKVGDIGRLRTLLTINRLDINCIYKPENVSLLHAALTFNQINVFRYLLSLNSGVGAYLGLPIRVNAKNSKGDSVIMDAVKSGRSDFVEAVLSAPTFPGREALDLSTRDIASKTPLHVTAGKGDLVSTRLLLDAGALMDARDSLNCSPFVLAAFAGQRSIMDEFVRRGCDVNQKIYENNRTVLHEVSEIGSLAAVEALLDCGARIDEPDSFGYTPIVLACLKKQAGVVLILIGRGANTGVIDEEDGWSLINFVVEAEAANIIPVLANAGVDMNSKNSLGDAPLHNASAMDSFEMARALVEAGADVLSKDGLDRFPWEAVDEECRTSRMLHDAANLLSVSWIDSAEEVIEILGRHNFLISVKTPLGQRISEVARAAGNDDLADELDEAYEAYLEAGL